MLEYKRFRSAFWMKVFEEEESVRVSANGMVRNLLESLSPRLCQYSSSGWRSSANHEGIFNLYIPAERMDLVCRAEMEKIKSWAEKANQCIWLAPNKNTRAFFSGNELDACLAADWNFDFDRGTRTPLGDAEYQLKYNYPRGLIKPERANRLAAELASGIKDCADCLPYDLRRFIVTAIPATEAHQNKAAWKLARHTARVLGAPFMVSTLTEEKPQMKEQTVEDRIRIWNQILADKTKIRMSCDVQGKDVLIIDDLYQSGASIWCFARFLKTSCGAGKTAAITPVKARKDGDNT